APLLPYTTLFRSLYGVPNLNGDLHDAPAGGEAQHRLARRDDLTGDGHHARLAGGERRALDGRGRLGLPADRPQPALAAAEQHRREDQHQPGQPGKTLSCQLDHVVAHHRAASMSTNAVMPQRSPRGISSSSTTAM